jgi:hypothetical protein
VPTGLRLDESSDWLPLLIPLVLLCPGLALRRAVRFAIVV